MLRNPVPTGVVVKLLGNNVWGLLLAVTIGVPLYLCTGEEVILLKPLIDLPLELWAGSGLYALLVVGTLATGHPALLRGLGWGPPLLMLGAALLQLVIQYQGSALRARGRFGSVSGSAAAQALLGGGLGMVLVVRYGIPGLLWGWLAGTLVAVAWVRRAAPDVPLRPGACPDGIRMAKGGFVVFAAFLVSLFLRSVDRMAFIAFGEAEHLGSYGLGLMAAGLVLYLPEAAAAVLYPRIVAAADGALDPEVVRAQILRAQKSFVLKKEAGTPLSATSAITKPSEPSGSSMKS